MSDTNSSRLGLPYLAAGQAQKHLTINSLITRLDGLLQTAVESRSVAQQPDAPADGAIWLLPANPSGADWAGKGGLLARYDAGAWSFTAPIAGQSLFVRDEQGVLVKNDTDWLGFIPIGGGLYRNRLINGQFGIWQRGTSILCPANQTTYTADRWQVWSAGGVSVARRATSGLPTGATAALLVSSAGGLTSCAVSQAMESAMIGDLAGQSAVFSAWLYASDKVTPYLNLYVYGVADQSSTRAFVGSQPMGAIGPGWTRVVKRLSLPASISNGGQIEVGFGAVASGGSVGVALAQLEPGQNATPSEFRPPSLEAALCQRYYQLTPTTYGAVGGWSSTSAATMSAIFAAPMRTAPLCVAQGGALTVDCPGLGSSTTSVVGFSSTLTGVNINASSLTPGGQVGRFAGALSSIICSAEL